MNNFFFLLGGQIKKNQSISSDMADIFSNLYLAHAVEFNHYNDSNSDILRKYCVDRLIRENNVIINRVIDNYPGGLKYLLKLLQTSDKSINYQENRNLVKEIENNSKIIDTIKNGIYLEQPIIKTFENLNSLDSNTDEYKKNYENLISVGEYKNN